MMNKIISITIGLLLTCSFIANAQRATVLQGNENFSENAVFCIESIDAPRGEIMIGESDKPRTLKAGDTFRAGQPIIWPDVENPSLCFSYKSKIYRVSKKQMQKDNRIFADIFRLCHKGNYGKGADTFITEFKNIVKNEPHYMFDGRLRMRSTFKSDRQHYIAIPYSGGLLRVLHDTETYDLVFQKERIERALGIEITDGTELTLQYCRPREEGPAIPIGILRIIVE